MQAARDLDRGLSLEQAREYLSYDPETGHITWIKSKKGPHANIDDIAGRHRPDGYKVIGMNQKLYLAHRLAWFLYYGKWPKSGLDHVNGDPSDNRLCNLREATDSQNQCNRGLQSNNKYGAPGIYRRRNGTFAVELMLDHKKIHIKTCPTVEEAVKVSWEARQAYFGSFAPAHAASAQKAN